MSTVTGICWFEENQPTAAIITQISEFAETRKLWSNDFEISKFMFNHAKFFLDLMVKILSTGATFFLIIVFGQKFKIVVNRKKVCAVVRL